jgi:hypothetical protein
MTSYRLKFKHRHNKNVSCKLQFWTGLTFYLRDCYEWSFRLTGSELIKIQTSSKRSLQIGTQLFADNVFSVVLRH